MPTVHGTGANSSCFKRKRMDEHPGEEISDRPPDKKPFSTVSSTITLVEIKRDNLTLVASENWTKNTTAVPFNPDLVKQIYESELKGPISVSSRRVVVLEVSQYLEYYLWPNFNPDTASFEHVMSMILLINEKFRENVAAWSCFSDNRDMFKAFLETVLWLKERGRTLTITEKTNYLLFMINVFQSLEDDIVSNTVLKLASLQVWSCLSYGRFQMEMCLNPNLLKKWQKMVKKESKEAEKRREPFDLSSKLEVRFVKNLIEEFLEILDSQVFPPKQADDGDSIPGGSEQVDSECVLYCERFMEFLIDLLSQLPTRRFLRPVVADAAVVPKCHLSALYNHTDGWLFAQLVDMLQFYERFEINDHTGTQLSDDDVLVAHYSRIQAVQLSAFKKFPKLKELALANAGSIHKRADLTKKLSTLSPEELQDLVCNKLKLVSCKDPWAERVDFLLEVMVSFFEKRQSQTEAINALPLYPNEQIMWDESLVPTSKYKLHWGRVPCTAKA